MKEFNYKITDAAGIHARPAGILVKEAKKFGSTAAILVNGKQGDLKKIFTVMGLGAKQGDTVTIQVTGADEGEAAAAIEAAFKANL